MTSNLQAQRTTSEIGAPVRMASAVEHASAYQVLL